MTDNATIRAWATDNGMDCPARGKIPTAIRQAYTLAHGGPDPEPEVETPADEEPAFTVGVDLYDHESSADLADHLVNALWSTWLAGYQAGKAEARAELLAVLTGDGA